MFRPEFLQKGDRIRIVSPSGKINPEKVLPAIELLKNRGYEVLTGAHIFASHYQFAGTDEQRLRDLQEAVDDPLCKAIICSRGGYGAIHLAKQIDLSGFHKTPKWLVGFSDITVLHAGLQKESVCSVHGAMPGFYLKNGQTTDSYCQLLSLLEGQNIELKSPANSSNRTGQGKGELTGGNLSILYSLLGTHWTPQTNGKILFLEDVSEHLYHIDRMIYSLKLARKFEHLQGLIIGGFTKVQDNRNSPFGQSVVEIIQTATKEYNYPVCFDFPSGHIEDNMPLLLGGNYQLKTNTSGAELILMMKK